jgi:menaquinone reductase, iron-sulfur cluster-binding subunit
VSTRMRGVVEKCTFCHHRLNEARSKAYLEGTEISEVTYLPACAEACPSNAIFFGNLLDQHSEVARMANDPRAFRVLSKLHTEPKVYYLSSHQWVHNLANKNL